MEETYEIVIDYADTDKFKEGISDLRRQTWHIEAQIKLLETYRDQLVGMRTDAINMFCDPDNEIGWSKIKIPKRFAKVR